MTIEDPHGRASAPSSKRLLAPAQGDLIRRRLQMARAVPRQAEEVGHPGRDILASSRRRRRQSSASYRDGYPPDIHMAGSPAILSAWAIRWLSAEIGSRQHPPAPSTPASSRNLPLRHVADQSDDPCPRWTVRHAARAGDRCDPWLLPIVLVELDAGLADPRCSPSIARCSRPSRSTRWTPAAERAEP